MSQAALRFRAKLRYASAARPLLESRGLWLFYYYAPPAHAKIAPLLSVGLAGAVLTALPLNSRLSCLIRLDRLRPSDSRGGAGRIALLARASSGRGLCERCLAEANLSTLLAWLERHSS